MLFRKPVSTPDQVRGRLFRDHARAEPFPRRCVGFSWGATLGPSVASADYYREQAETCLHMSRACPDPILAEQLGALAAEFSLAATELAGDDRAPGYPAYDDS